MSDVLRNIICLARLQMGSQQYSFIKMKQYKSSQVEITEQKHFYATLDVDYALTFRTYFKNFFRLLDGEVYNLSLEHIEMFVKIKKHADNFLLIVTLTPKQ